MKTTFFVLYLLNVKVHDDLGLYDKMGYFSEREVKVLKRAK